MNEEQKAIMAGAQRTLADLGNERLSGTANALAYYLQETLKVVEAQEVELNHYREAVRETAANLLAVFHNVIPADSDTNS